MNKLQLILVFSCLHLPVLNIYCQIKEESLDLVLIESDSINSLKDLQNSYLSKGYLTAGFDSIIFDSSITKAYFNKGEQYFWGNINYVGFEPFELKKIGLKGTLLNRKLDYFQFLDIQKTIITYLENNSYPFSSVHFEIDSFNNNILSGRFVVNKNNKVLIDTIIIKGNAKISGYFLQNYTGIKIGEEYSEDKIKNLDELIEEIGFIQQTRSSGVEFTYNKAKVYTFLKPKQANKFNGIIGFLPDDNKPGKLIFTGEVNMQLSNSFGKGEIINVDWQKLELSSQDLKLEYDHPYVFKSKTGINAIFNLYKKDSSYLNVNPKVTLKVFGVGANHFKVFFSSKKTSVLINSNITIPFADMSSTIYGLGYYFNNLDYKVNPRKGFVIDLEAGVGNRKYLNAEQVQFVDTEQDKLQKEGRADFSWYQSVSTNTVIKIQSQTQFIRSNILLDNEMYQIGGLRNIRGIDERSIIASEFSALSFELRYLYEKNSNFFIFFDAAYYEKRTITLISDNPYGFGAGMNFSTKAGVFSLNYALGKQFDNPVQIRSAKVHIGYINRF